VAASAFRREEFEVCANHCIDLLCLNPESFGTWSNPGLAWHMAGHLINQHRHDSAELAQGYFLRD
jgi:hypothetical protein